MQILSLGEHRLKIGEGPVWDVEDQSLLAVDIVGQQVVAFDGTGYCVFQLAIPEPVVAATRDTNSNLLVTLSDGVHHFDEERQQAIRVATFPVKPGAHLNDGKVDRQGRIVAVGSDKCMAEPLGDLFRLERDGSVTHLADGYILGNGPCWSADGSGFYVADSIVKQIYAYDYPESGPLIGRRLFADTSELGGIPDGATIDRDGRLWVALCGAGKIICFDPSGKVEDCIEMPTAWVSSVMFGGPALDRLYVTTLDPSVLGGEGDEHCGRLFMIEDLGVTGLPEMRASGDIINRFL